jgi:Flp pilus assembly pilin Flp
MRERRTGRRTDRASRRRSLDDGQGLVEYAVLLGLLAMSVIVALVFLGGNVSGTLQSIGDSIGAAAGISTTVADGGGGGGGGGNDHGGHDHDGHHDGGGH